MSQLRTGIRWSLGVLVALTLPGMPGGARGQDLSEPPGRAETVQEVDPSLTGRTFGTADSVAYPVQAADFQLGGGTEIGGVFNNLDRNCNVGFMPGNFCAWVAGVRLPAGALVTSIQLDACDTSATTELTFGFARKPRAGTGATPLASGSTGVGATPGCVFFNLALPTPTTVDNANNLYIVQVIAQPDGQKTVFAGMRVFYTLQVSPAPTMATFSDVPTTHPFFQFVEALVASGITSGCGGGNYCPDSPLTRGQMAVFLSKALGLHFAP